VSVFGEQNGDFLRRQTVQGLQVRQDFGWLRESDVAITCPDAVR